MSIFMWPFRLVMCVGFNLFLLLSLFFDWVLFLFCSISMHFLHILIWFEHVVLHVSHSHLLLDLFSFLSFFSLFFVGFVCMIFDFAVSFVFCFGCCFCVWCFSCAEIVPFLFCDYLFILMFFFLVWGSIFWYCYRIPSLPWVSSICIYVYCFY